MKQKRDENSFLLHGGILALASILVRFIGMIYRVPMVNIIGSEGNGYYANAYSVYNILLLLSSYSMPLAVSKMVSARVACGKWKETQRVVLVSAVFSVTVGLVFGLLTYFGADFFCSKILNSPKAAIALRWMAPTVFIMAVLGVLRGFFQGLQTTIPTALSQILEQIVNAIVSVVMAFVLFKYGTDLAAVKNDASLAAAWGAAGGTIGTGAGALTAFLFCLVIFLLYRDTLRKKVASDRRRSVKNYATLMKILTLTAVPVILSTAAYNCIDIIDTAIFNAVMKKDGYSVEAYTAILGDYNSAYLTLIHLPVAFASAIASALVPSLAAAHSEGDRRQVYSKVALTVKITLIISIPCAFGMMAIGGNLAKLLFSNIADEAQKYLVAGGMAVVFYSLSTVTNAILQSLNHMEKPVIHALIALAVHAGVLVLLLLVFKLEIMAVIIAYMIFSLLMSVLNLISIFRLIGYVPDPWRSIALPCAASVIMVVFCFLISFIVSRLLDGRPANLIIVLFSLIIGAAVYFASILLMGAIGKNELREIPGGRKLVKLAVKCRLLVR